MSVLKQEKAMEREEQHTILNAVAAFTLSSVQQADSCHNHRKLVHLKLSFLSRARKKSL